MCTAARSLNRVRKTRAQLYRPRADRAREADRSTSCSTHGSVCAFDIGDVWHDPGTLGLHLCNVPVASARVGTDFPKVQHSIFVEVSHALHPVQNAVAVRVKVFRVGNAVSIGITAALDSVRDPIAIKIFE